ncbi:unnamed protein product [Camellia sinensis]
MCCMFIMASSSMRIAAIVFYLCFLTFATFHNCFCNGNSSIVCSKTEKQALLKFKQDLKDPSNRLSSWAGDNCCQWSGVVCDNFTGHVHVIHLPYNYSDADCHYNGSYSEYEACWRHHQLGGKINPSLLDLKHLRYLDLSGNHFGGIRIPSFIGSIGSLRYLDLSGAEFSGAIPHQLGNLTMIRYLDLSFNYLYLQGQIPLSTQLQSLENSSFVGNKLCGPPLPNCDTNKAIPKVGHGGNEEGEGFPEVWFYAISALGFVIGFWVVMGPLLFKMHWRIAYFRFLDDIWYNFCNFILKCHYICN